DQLGCRIVAPEGPAPGVGEINLLRGGNLDRSVGDDRLERRGKRLLISGRKDDETWQRNQIHEQAVHVIEEWELDRALRMEQRDRGRSGRSGDGDKRNKGDDERQAVERDAWGFFTKSAVAQSIVQVVDDGTGGGVEGAHQRRRGAPVLRFFGRRVRRVQGHVLRLHCRPLAIPRFYTGGASR